MFLINFLKKNIAHIKEGGILIFIKKSHTLLKLTFQLPLYISYLPVLGLIYLIGPFFLIRLSPLKSSRIGAFAATTELYCCEREAKINQPNKKYLDLFYLPFRSVSNRQLANMWKRKLNIYLNFSYLRFIT